MSYDEERRQTAALFRRMADELSGPKASVTVTRSRAAAFRLARTAARLYRDGDDALRLAHDFSSSGYPKGSDNPPVSGGGTSDPTGLAAAAQADGDLLDPPSLWEPRLRSSMQLIDHTSGQVDNLLHTILHRADITQVAEERRPTAECAEPSCSEAAEPGRQGRCAACAKWRQRNTGPDGLCPPVPAENIKARQVRRRWEHVG